MNEEHVHKDTEVNSTCDPGSHGFRLLNGHRKNHLGLFFPEGLLLLGHMD